MPTLLKLPTWTTLPHSKTTLATTVTRDPVITSRNPSKDASMKSLRGLRTGPQTTVDHEHRFNPTNLNVVANYYDAHVVELGPHSPESDVFRTCFTESQDDILTAAAEAEVAKAALVSRDLIITDQLIAIENQRSKIRSEDQVARRQAAEFRLMKKVIRQLRSTMAVRESRNGELLAAHAQLELDLEAAQAPKQQSLSYASDEIARLETLVVSQDAKIQLLEKEKEQLHDLRTTVKGIRSANIQLEADNNALSTSLAQSSEETSRLRRSVADSNVRIQDSQTIIARLHETIAALQSDKTYLQAALDQTEAQFQAHRTSVDNLRQQLKECTEKEVNNQLDLIGLQVAKKRLEAHGRRLSSSLTHSRAEITHSQAALDNATTELKDLRQRYADKEVALSISTADNKKLEEDYVQCMSAMHDADCRSNFALQAANRRVADALQMTISLESDLEVRDEKIAQLREEIKQCVAWRDDHFQDAIHYKVLLDKAEFDLETITEKYVLLKTDVAEMHSIDEKPSGGVLGALQAPGSFGNRESGQHTAEGTIVHNGAMLSTRLHQPTIIISPASPPVLDTRNRKRISESPTAKQSGNSPMELRGSFGRPARNENSVPAASATSGRSTRMVSPGATTGERGSPPSVSSASLGLASDEPLRQRTTSVRL